MEVYYVVIELSGFRKGGFAHECECGFKSSHERIRAGAGAANITLLFDVRNYIFSANHSNIF